MALLPVFQNLDQATSRYHPSLRRKSFVYRGVSGKRAPLEIIDARSETFHEVLTHDRLQSFHQVRPNLSNRRTEQNGCHDETEHWSMEMRPYATAFSLGVSTSYGF